MATKEEKKKYPDWWYQPQHQEEMNALAGQITSRPAFKFKVNQEALYDYYKGEHDRQGRLDRLDTEAKGAGLTGGFDNSYATQAGQQAYENQIGKLRLEVAPELRQAALKKYTQEGNALVGQYEQLQKQEENAYKQWQKDHKDEIKAWEKGDTADRFIALHPELDSYRDHTGGYYKFAVEKALRDENLTRAEFEKLMKYYGISFGDADVSQVGRGKDPKELVSYDAFQQELQATTPQGKAASAVDRIKGSAMAYDPMATHTNNRAHMYFAEKWQEDQAKAQTEQAKAQAEAQAEVEFTKAMENHGYSVKSRLETVEKLKQMGAHDSFVQGVLTEKQWSKLRDQAIKVYESGNGTMNLAATAYDSYTEYLRAYLTMADYCDVTVAVAPGNVSSDGRYESTGNAMFDAFTAEYISRLSQDNGYAARFKAKATADTYARQADLDEAYAREVAYWRKRKDMINQTTMGGNTLSERDRDILGYIARTYGTNTTDAHSKAELAAKNSRRLATQMSFEVMARAADDFAKKSAYDSSISNDLYKNVNGGKEYMEPEEIAVFNYLYATEGYQQAQLYYNSLSDLRNRRKGQGMADAADGNYLKQLWIKTKSGFNQFSSGIGSLFGKKEAKGPTALQYANAAVDEDLADVGLKWYNFAEGEEKVFNPKIFGRSLGQLGGDLVQTTTNMLPSIGASVLSNAIVPGSGGAVGLGLMGTSSAGNAYQDMLNQGYSKGSAASYGYLVGASEIVLGKALGGISKLGGGTLTKKATASLAKMDDVLGRFAKSTGGQLLMNAGSEALEEGLQSVLEPYIKTIVTGEEFTVDMEETLYSALMGFISGGMFEGVDMGTKSLMTTVKNKLSTQKAGKVDMIEDAGAQTGSVDSTDTQLEDLSAEQIPDAPVMPQPGAQMQGQTSMDTVGNTELPSLAQPMTGQLQEGLAEQVQVPKVNQAAQVATPKATTPNSRGTESTATVAKTEVSPLKAASKKYGAQAAMMENAYQQGQDVERFDREYKLAYDMGREGASRELLESGGAFAYLTAEQKNAAYQSGAAAAENAGIVAAAVKSLGITGEHAGVLTQSFNANQINAKDYAMGLQEAYEAGKAGIPLAEAGSHAAKLTDAQRQIAYNQGQKAHGRQVAKQQARARKNRSDKGADTSKGKVHFEGDRSSLNKTQRASMDAMEVLAKTLGIQIYVFESEVDENGNHVGANGWYDPSDGSIHIDLYAGNSGKGTMLFTVAHELTHFIKQWSPAKFEVLANFLTKQYTAQGQSISELVEAQQDKAARNGRELDYDAAYEEMVADSMESMLSDGSIIEMMAELKQQDHGLWQKIRDWFKDLAGKLRAVVDAYKGVQPDSTEGRMVADMKDMIGTLEALYMDALADASENFDAGVQKNTTEDSGEVKYSFKGYADDGKGIYESNFPKGTPKKAKGERILEYIQNVWSKKPITLRIEQNGTVRYIEAQFDPTFSEDKNVRTDASKLMGGNRHGNAVEQRVTLDLADDYYQIAEEAQYNYSKDETGKNSETHKDVKVWHYFVNDIYFAEQGSDELIPFTVSINVKEKENGNFFYSFSAEKTEGTPTRRTLHADVNDGDNAIANGSSSNASIRNPNEIVNKEFSDRDSVGNQLSEEQQEYFKDSAVRDNDGRLLVLYHQTDGDFTIFDTRHPGAGSRDNGTPFGIFMKRSAGDIGLAGKKQMALYANITNPLRATNREDLARKLCEISERYASISDQHKKLDAEYREKFEQAKKAWVNYITEWRSANPGASRNALNADPKFNELFDAEDNVVDEWTAAADRLSAQAKEAITEDLRKAGYDGVFLAEDVGSWGRKTDAIIALDPEQVKNISNKKPTQNPDIRYSQRDVGRQEAVTQALEKENAKLREDVAELRELVSLQRQVTNGTKFTKTSVEAAAISLKQSANAKGDTKGFAKLLNGLYEYIASTKELTWEGVKEQAQGAVDWLWEHIDRRGKRSDYAQEILTQLHGTRVRLDESQMAEAEHRFGSYNEFRKRLMGSITLAKDANTSLDSLWAEFSQLYPDVFDGEITAADMPGALADIIERLRTPEATALDYARDREMMEQDLLRQVYDSYWRVSTLYTPADVGARRINKLKMEHYQRMDKLKQQHRETLDQMKQAHQARLEQVRMEHRAKLEERTEQITKKYQEARKQNVEGRKKTEQRQKIRKTIRELSKLLAHGTKERNVKEGMKDFVSTAIASAEVLFTDEYTNEDMIRNGVECECAGWESSLIDKTRALIRQRDELLAGVTAAGEVEDVIAGDLSGYEQRMNLVSRLDGKISENMGKLKDVFARERSRLNKATASSLLNSLAEEYWKLGTADEEYIRGALDENVHQHLMNLSQEIGGTTVKDMSLSQLEQLHRAYTMVLTTVRNANKSFAENLKGSRMEQAKAVTGELAQAGKKRKKQTKGQIARAKRSWNNLKSVFAFERIGSGTLKQLYENLRGGEDTWMVDMDHAREHFLKAASDTGYNGWDLNKQTHSFESSTGLEFDLNLGQIMSIYAYARRGEQALDHLMKGGFVFDKYTEERVTEHGIPKTYLKDDATAYNLSLETVQEIIGKLTPEQKSFVEAMQDYLSDTMGSKGNEVSMKLYGVKLFGEKNYFPLRSSGVYLSKAADQEQQKQQGQVSVKNAGFTHSTTPNAANPVVLSGFMDVWANHVNDMSMYHAFVLPMEDFNKVYHYSTPHTEESQSGAVKQAIINAHGSAATDYINQLIRDLNGGVVTDPREGQYKAWISKFKKASVMASASVVVQQPTAIVRALAYIDPKYFGAFSISRGIGRALGNKATHSHTKLYDELKKYAPVAAIKQMGRFDTDMGKGAVDYLTAKEFEGIKEKTKAIFKEKGYLGRRMDETMGFMAERADEITWLQIWQAVKKEVAHKQKLKVGSEEHLQAAGKRFTEVITRTQVYDSVFSRSANMRSKGAFMTMATSFMAEPTTTANMLMDAIRKARQGDVKHFLRVGASVAGTIIFNNILRSAVYAGRDDDEDETYLEKYLQALAGGMLDDVNFMNYLPFWRDVWSLMQGYDVERSDMSVIGTLIDAGRSLADALAKDTDGMTEEELEAHNEKVKNLGWKFVDGLASAVGLPEKNLRRDILGAVNFFDTIKADGNRKTTAGSLKDKVWEDFVSSMPGVNIMVDTDSRTDNLYDAIVAGDAAYVERLRSGYQTEQSYLQAKRRGLKENDLRIKTAAEARIAGNLETYMNLAEEIIAEGYFTQDDVVVAINAVINELTPNSGSSTSASKAKGLFDANAFATAISQGDAEMAKTIQADIIRTAQLNGKTEEEAQKSFISSATSACKEMFGEGELTEDQAVDALVRFCGKERNEARASVAYWEFIMEHPDTGASAGWFETYYNKVEKSGIAIEDYVEYRNRKTGYTKRAEILDVIDGMGLTKAQKDALYRAEGYAESTLNEAPWHK